MLFDNGAACRYWLQRLQQLDGEHRLLGTDIKPVLDMAYIYETGLGPIDFGAEIQLKGERGIDLSVQYPVQDFVQGNPLQHPLLAATGDFLHDYTQKLLQERFFPIVENSYTYLEADTSKGNGAAAAIFLNLSGEAARVMLPFILQKQQQGDRMTAVLKLLEQVKDNLASWYFGFMHSRRELPLRLSFMVREEAGFAGLLSSLSLLGLDSYEAAEQLKAVDELKLFTYMLDIDILADGSVGSTWGVELTPMALLPVQQERMLVSDKFTRLLELLKQWGMADNRCDLLPSMIWDCLYGDPGRGYYVMFSHLSHIKLRWQNEVPYPAKVYLQLRELPKQYSINESIRTML